MSTRGTLAEGVERGGGAGPGRLATAWCAVGGERGGVVVPRWFGVLPELGIERVHLFWAVPETDGSAALDALRPASGRWLAELRMLGMEGELAIKRGAPGPWLSSLAGLSGDALVVLGPSRPGRMGETLTHLLEKGTAPLLLLPDLARLPNRPLLEHPVVDAGSPREAEAVAGSWGWEPAAAQRVDLSALDAARAVRSAVRLAEDVDATLLVVPRRAAELAPAALEQGNLPVLVTAQPTGG